MICLVISSIEYYEQSEREELEDYDLKLSSNSTNYLTQWNIKNTGRKVCLG